MEQSVKDTIKILDNIYLNCESIAKARKQNHIPLNTLKMVLDEIRIPDNKPIQEIVDNYNKLLGILYDSCEKYADKVLGKKKIHLITLKSFIELAKKNIV